MRIYSNSQALFKWQILLFHDFITYKSWKKAFTSSLNCLMSPLYCRYGVKHYIINQSIINCRIGLRERLRSKKNIVVAEGYVFEFERRGYLRAGCFVPEVVLNQPELVRSLHEEFVHAGSDVVLAFTVSENHIKYQFTWPKINYVEINEIYACT